LLYRKILAYFSFELDFLVNKGYLARYKSEASGNDDWNIRAGRGRRDG
jgi:hypothetical protein